MSAMIRVIVADEHHLYREALSRLLERYNFTVIGAADNPAELIDLLPVYPLPDIAIISYKSTRPSTLSTILSLKENYPGIKILITTLFNNLLPVDEFIRSGIEGVVIKSSTDPMQIIQALQSIYQGEAYYSH